MAEAETHLVILGGGAAGLEVAKWLLRNHVGLFRVTMISPSKEFVFLPATPRMIVKPEYRKEGTLCIPEHYEKKARELASGKRSFQFIQGVATDLNFASRTVSYRPVGGAEKEGVYLSYDKLLIATGCRQASGLFGASDEEELFHRAHEQLRKELESASSIAIIGGGATGVETVTEIVEHYPRLAGHAQLFSGSKLPLEKKFNSLPRAELCVKRMEKMGIETIQGYAKRVDAHTVEGPDGTQKRYDVIIDASGGKPNSQCVRDSSLLDSQGYIKTDPSFRVVEHVYAIGDVVSGTVKLMFDIHGQVECFRKALLFDLGLHKGKVPKYDPTRLQYSGGVSLGSRSSIGVIRGVPIPQIFLNRMHRDAGVGHMKHYKP